MPVSSEAQYGDSFSRNWRAIVSLLVQTNGITTGESYRASDHRVSWMRECLRSDNTHTSTSHEITKQSIFQIVGGWIAACALSSPAGIIHRYSFDQPAGQTTITDSVGGANGVLAGGLNGNAADYDGTGQLLLPGGTGSALVLRSYLATLICLITSSMDSRI